MKKTLLFAAMTACLLAGCSKTSINTKTGKIDCQSISYTTDLNHRNSMSYTLNRASVFEYKSANGSKIYLSANYYSVILYENAYDKTWITYNSPSLIGYLDVEQLYYYDLDSSTIDCVVKYSQYKGKDDKDSEGRSLNHLSAYSCASKGYYTTDTIIKGITDNTLERHSYIKLGDNAIVSYTPRIS